MACRERGLLAIRVAFAAEVLEAHDEAGRSSRLKRGKTAPLEAISETTGKITMLGRCDTNQRDIARERKKLEKKKGVRANEAR